MSFDVFIETAREEREYFENYRQCSKLIKHLARKMLEDGEVYVFGSVVEGRHTPASDIDILIVSRHVPKRNEDKAKIVGQVLKEIDVSAPFEIHLATPELFELYKKFAKKMEKV
jgi:predicted nucleotidyltransferase